MGRALPFPWPKQVAKSGTGPGRNQVFPTFWEARLDSYSRLNGFAQATESTKQQERVREMEARQTFKGAIAPKGLVVVLAICATVAVAATAATISNNMSDSSASVKSTVHAAPGTVLRQDNPVQAASALIDRGAERGSTGIQNGSRGGVLENSGVPGLSADEHGPDSDLTRALPTAAAGYPAPNREGYGQ